MSLIDHHEGLLIYDYAQFARAKDFAFRMWCELAAERRLAPPDDLSGACKYGSQFVRQLFGGVIEGHFEHQYNRIAGRLVDLGHDARDVGRMRQPYLHEAEYFEIPEHQARLEACMPRVMRWTEAFMRELGDIPG